MGSDFSTRIKKTKPDKGFRYPKGSRLAIVGNGMVGCHFCAELVRRQLNQFFDIHVFGEELEPAYNRIQLSSYVDHRDSSQLILEGRDWYQKHNIQLNTGVRVESIDTGNRQLFTSEGQMAEYDVLVLATGSRPFAPPIEGVDLPNVFLYRTIADLEKIMVASENKDSATIIGGGLLGLEAAQAVQKMGLNASVVERANFLMPQQLSRAASEFLEQKIVANGITPLLGKSRTTISESDTGLCLTFDDDSRWQTDLVIISAGITPNTEIALNAGLKVGARGGVVVDEQLQASEPHIYAIGECALFNGRIFGLAAPGYAMATHVAKRLAGLTTEAFPVPDMSTRLKMLGVDVVIIGDSLEEGTRYEYQSDGRYRMMVLGPRGQLIGAVGVGEWGEAGRMQSLYREGSIIRKAEVDSFVSTGDLSSETDLTPVSQLPESRIICNCMQVTKGQLMSCIADGINTPEALESETGASTVCGSCAPLVGKLCGMPVCSKKPIAVRRLFAVSILALVAVLAIIFTAPPEMASSVESVWFRIDKLWRDSQIKQITGFSLVGIFAFGSLLSARKRFKWFRIGHFAKWRFFHAAFGLVSLLALFLHTGFRFGSNLNFWLMFVFVGLNLLGAFAGMVSAIEATGTSSLSLTARQFRPALIWAHVILFWPLPVLLIFHILSVYLY